MFWVYSIDELFWFSVNDVPTSALLLTDVCKPSVVVCAFIVGPNITRLLPNAILPLWEFIFTAL